MVINPRRAAVFAAVLAVVAVLAFAFNHGSGGSGCTTYAESTDGAVLDAEYSPGGCDTANLVLGWITLNNVPSEPGHGKQVCDVQSPSSGIDHKVYIGPMGDPNSQLGTMTEAQKLCVVFKNQSAAG